MIEVSHFSKCYDHALAVNDLSFQVAAGEVLGLIGRNGAGKTTTLRSITGIIPPSGGTICVHGHDLQADPLAVKRHTAYVPDDPRLFEDLTVEQHLLFQASVYGIEDPSAEMARLLERFELEPKRHSRADSLSRGMRQKLAICAALLQAPSALLLDEPMTGLDPQAIRMLKVSVEEVAARGTAVIISSHLLAMVEDICSHVMVVDRGRCRFQGTLEEFRTAVDPDASQPNALELAFFQAIDQAEEELHRELAGTSSPSP